MSEDLQLSIDAILMRMVSGEPRVPGVVAVLTDRERDIYVGATGLRSLAGETAMSPDTVCAIFSTTKAIAGTVCLQLVERGELDLDAPAREYVPRIAELQVIEGFDADGAPQLRPPRTEVTTRMLLLHTAGFGYDFFNETYRRLAEQHGQPSVITATREAIMTPLLFDPGERWEYGSNIDWAGQVVEGITGRRLGEVMHDWVLEPLGMHDTGFALTADMRGRLAAIHQRGEDGSLTPTDIVLPQEPEVQMGGHGLYSTALDYTKFIRMWLNDGAGPDGPILRPETVEMAARNHLGELKVSGLPGVIPTLSNDAEFFPGMPKSWALTFMLNDEPADTGRPANTLAWAGLANLYYWIDRVTGIGGFWATQILPFVDPTSIAGYFEFETAAYAGLAEAARRSTAA